MSVRTYYMKKKLFFGLIGFGALLCGSLVSLVSLSSQKAEVKEVRAEDVPTVTIAQEDMIPENGDRFQNAPNFIYFGLVEKSEEHQNKIGFDVIPYVEGEANRFTGDDVIKVYNADGTLKESKAANIYKLGTVSGNINDNNVGYNEGQTQPQGTYTGGLRYYSNYYLQIHGWGDINILEGETIVFDGTAERDVEGVKARLVFDNVSFVRTADGYVHNDTPEVYTLNSDEISNIRINSYSGDIQIKVNTKTANYTTINTAWDFNHNRGYDFDSVVTITPEGGTPFTKSLNLIKESETQYMILSTSWAGNTYWGDGFSLEVGTKIKISGSQTYKDSYLVQFNIDLELTVVDLEGTISVAGKEPFSVAIDNTTIIETENAHSHIGEISENWSIKATTAEDDGVIVVKSWLTNYKISNGAKVTTSSGEETTLNVFFIKDEECVYTFVFSKESWIDNFYDFQPGDTVSFNGTASGNSDGRQVTFNVNFSYTFFKKDSYTYDYTDRTVTIANGATQWNEDGTINQEVLYIEFGGYLEDDNFPGPATGQDWGGFIFNGTSDVDIYRADGTTEKIDSVLIKAPHGPGLEEYCFLFPSWRPESFREFKTGDRVVINTSVTASTEEADYTVKFNFTVWYVEEYNKSSGEESAWVDETNYAPIPNVINAIDAIGEVTLDSKDEIDAAREAFDDLTERQQYLVTNKSALLAAEAAYAELLAAKQASDVDALINAIGEVTLDSKDEIDAARSAYDALSDAAKAKVTKLDILETAEAVYSDLNDRALAAHVDELIDAIGTVEATDACERRIAEARNAYEALNSTQASYVTKLETLEAAEAALEVAKLQKAAQPAINAIDAIGEVDASKACRNKIENASNIYNSLDRDAQAYVTNYNVLVAAKAAFAQALANAQQSGKDQIDALYAEVNLKKYSKDNQEVIAQMVEEAKANIEDAKDQEEINGIIESFQAELAEIPQKKAAAKKGCGGSIVATSVVLSTLALAGLGLVISKKRKED